MLAVVLGASHRACAGDFSLSGEDRPEAVSGWAVPQEDLSQEPQGK